MVKSWEEYYTFRGPGSVAACAAYSVGGVLVGIGPSNFELTAPVIASAKTVEALLTAFRISTDLLVPPVEDEKIAWLILRDASERLKERAAEAAKTIGGGSLRQEAACRALSDCAKYFLEAAKARRLEIKLAAAFSQFFNILLKDVPKLTWRPLGYPNYDRDKLIYESRRDGKTWKEIAKLLKDHPEWEPVGDRGMDKATKAYIKKCGMPKLIDGKRGRPARSR